MSWVRLYTKPIRLVSSIVELERAQGLDPFNRLQTSDWEFESLEAYVAVDLLHESLLRHLPALDIECGWPQSSKTGLDPAMRDSMVVRLALWGATSPLDPTPRAFEGGCERICTPLKRRLCGLSSASKRAWDASVMLDEGMGSSGNHFGSSWYKFGDFDFRRRAQRGGPR